MFLQWQPDHQFPQREEELASVVDEIFRRLMVISADKFVGCFIIRHVKIRLRSDHDAALKKKRLAKEKKSSKKQQNSATTTLRAPAQAQGDEVEEPSVEEEEEVELDDELNIQVVVDVVNVPAPCQNSALTAPIQPRRSLKRTRFNADSLRGKMKTER